MEEFKTKYTIVIVTHNMQQAARVSDRTAFFTTEVDEKSDIEVSRPSIGSNEAAWIDSAEAA